MSHVATQDDLVMNTSVIFDQASVISQTLNNRGHFHTPDELAGCQQYATEVKMHAILNLHDRKFRHRITDRLMVIVRIQWNVSTDGTVVTMTPSVSNVWTTGINENWRETYEDLNAELMQNLGLEEDA